MSKIFDPQKNYEETKKSCGYVSRKEATQADYDRIGFMSGLEVHQQLKTKEKLFCNCPAGIYQKSNDYNAEVIRHMRPTLSELGGYDGTALMEYKTRKEIVYRLKHETACTYEIDDTPPFKIDREALGIALEISLLSKLNIVGEVHITRKQYLDGSIPTGFQRTAILGVEGEIELKNKKVRLIQLSIEEDACREVSDIGHRRIYMTDRLGMPLIETVTYPDMANPDEVMEAANYIRFLNRSTGKVRTGIGAGREDVNVSCKGGSRVEIKGVSHNKWIPELTHNECFRQWSLLKLRDKLLNNIENTIQWKIVSKELNYKEFNFIYQPLKDASQNGSKIIAVSLPEFKSVLSHFTQPNKCFANEISERLKVIACLEQPNMTHNEQFIPDISNDDFNNISKLLDCSEKDAIIVFWAPHEDVATALETIEERCKLAFIGVPNETRKSFSNGTTIFERVLPGADRMYPDTDSAPIPLENEYLDDLQKQLPVDLIERHKQLEKWKIPHDTFHFIFKNNLLPTIENIINDFKANPVFVATLFSHNLKNIQRKIKPVSEFNFQIIYALFKFLNNQNIHFEYAKEMLPIIYQHPKIEFESVLTTLNFKKRTKNEIFAPVKFLKERFKGTSKNKGENEKANWVMGQLRRQAIGNLGLKELINYIHNNEQ